MNIVTRLTLGFLVVILVILSIDALILYRNNISNYEADMKSDMKNIGFAIKFLVEDTWEHRGEKAAIDLIEDANVESSRIKIRFVWLDLPVGDSDGPRIPGEQVARVRTGGSASFIDDGQEFVYVYIPLTVDQSRASAIELSENLSFLRHHTQNATIRIAVLTATLLIFAYAFSALMSFRIIGKPLGLLLAKIRRVGSGDYSGPLSIPGNNELSRLATGINEMCVELEATIAKLRVETEARISALDQLRHEDRLKTVGRLASGIAHELGTPLNVISGRAEMILKSENISTRTGKNASIIKEQCDRIASMFRQLLDFARQRSPHKGPLDLPVMLRNTVDLMLPLARTQKIELVLEEGGTPARVFVDAEQMQQVMMNLVTNAIHAMPDGGRINLGISRLQVQPPETVEGPAGEYLCVSVEDQGCGIAAENIPHVFEPFFTTKDVGHGTGLGLSIVHGIVHENGGWIEVESEPGKGSRFSIYLPEEAS